MHVDPAAPPRSNRMATMEAVDGWMAEAVVRRSAIFLDHGNIRIHVEPDCFDVRDGEELPVYGEVHVPEGIELTPEEIRKTIDLLAAHLAEAHPNPRLN
jgi:hypothetical protein